VRGAATCAPSAFRWVEIDAVRDVLADRGGATGALRLVERREEGTQKRALFQRKVSGQVRKERERRAVRRRAVRKLAVKI
jgi:hypothetical protein